MNDSGHVRTEADELGGRLEQRCGEAGGDDGLKDEGQRGQAGAELKQAGAELKQAGESVKDAAKDATGR